MKAKVTYEPAEGEPDELNWAGTTFKKGQAVEVTDAKIIEKAEGNQYFKVVITERDDKDTNTQVQPAPSNTVSPQHAAPKPGEPMPQTPSQQSRK